jgi:hypothetical protein
MKRSWNGWLWLGFFLVLVGLFSYIPLFARFPVTRDFPWVNLLLLAAGLVALGVGLARAFREPQRYRGRIFGSVLAALGLLGTGLFCVGTFYVARQLPASASAPRVGQRAPDFVLPDQDGKPVALAGLLSSSSSPTTPLGSVASTATKSGGVLLIFYRGRW